MTIQRKPIPLKDALTNAAAALSFAPKKNLEQQRTDAGSGFIFASASVFCYANVLSARKANRAHNKKEAP